LVKVHKYNKLATKIQLVKIKSFDMFFTPARFQQLTSSLLSSVGTKGTNAPNVMAVLAEQNSKKGDHEKA
jgi:tetratricopeptide (TPR) repeat protein